MSVEDAEREEGLEHAAEEISREERRGSLLLWLAVLGSPMAWAGHLLVNYSLEEWFACSESAKHHGEIVGFGVKELAIIVNTAMLALAAASCLAAFRCWRKLGGEDGNGEERTERARWMAFAGIVEGLLFLGIILLGYLPAVTIDVCKTTP